MDRYMVFEETFMEETHWGIYDQFTGSVLQWFASEQEAYDNIPQGVN